MGITVRRKDISLSQEVEYDLGFSGEGYQRATFWTASLRGYLSSGEEVESLSRSGLTAAEAISRLEEAIRAEGWEVIDSE